MQDSIENETAGVSAYIASVSDVSGLRMSQLRQDAHVMEFRRLLRDANALNALMGQDQHLSVGPIAVVKHRERDQPVHAGA